ncbi:MAG: DUF86 domain-containing protein [Deltaproteobacteria bacterium]|nr:DUF86 domain-containing protein [Deltaproteobacteria bacterium]
MTKTGRIRSAIVAERVAWIRKMLDGVQGLPLADYNQFKQDPRNPAAADSCLRRALEALLDLGRHILAKGHGRPVVEYKEIAERLHQVGVLSAEDSARLRTLAGYRNRMVHFYHEISEGELYEICTRDLGDIERVLDAVLTWIGKNPDKVDRAL